MPENIYEVIALGARYWFIFLGALIVLRTFGWLRRDRKEKHRRLRQLPDAGMIGEMVVLRGEGNLLEGMVMPVPREGVLGSFRSCDLVVPGEAIAPQHCDFVFRPGKGLVMRPRRRCAITADGEEIASCRAGERNPLRHGSRLQIGESILRLRLFVGIEAGEPVQHAYHPDLIPDPVQPEAWQNTPDIYHPNVPQWQNGEQYPLYGQPYPPSGQQPVQPQGMPAQPGQPGLEEDEDGWIRDPIYGTQPGVYQQPAPYQQPDEMNDDFTPGYARRHRRARRRDDAES